MRFVNFSISMLCLVLAGCIVDSDSALEGVPNRATPPPPNNRQPIPEGDPTLSGVMCTTVGAGGTPNQIARFTAAGRLGSSLIRDDGVSVSIGARPEEDGVLQVGTSDPRLNGISASSSGAAGVYGNGVTGVHGNGSNMGVFGYSAGYGVNGYGGLFGVFGYSGNFGVFGHGLGSGVHGEGGVYGVSAVSNGGDGVSAKSSTGYAGRFTGGKGVLVEGATRSQLEPLKDGEMVCGTFDQATGTYLLGRCDDRIKALEAELAAIKAHLGLR